MTHFGHGPLSTPPAAQPDPQWLPALYLVGGAVRDQLLSPSSVPDDLDFVYTAPDFPALLAFLAPDTTEVLMSRPQFLTHLIKHARYGKSDFALPRLETTYSDNRHPDSCAPTSLFSDLSRRDFTINAMARLVDPSDPSPSALASGPLYDPLDGQRDLRNKILRTCGDPVARLSEDPLRILRALRFAVRFGFELCCDLSAALTRPFAVPALRTVGPDRVYQETAKMFAHDAMAAIAIMLRYEDIGRCIISDFGISLGPSLRAKKRSH